ncbi:hypothetical protein [Streptomyces tropicalis]|uniref:Uncharacterized protein n=1 Tax=Streptomyces tropicalis TaxID=3034234 RepID=A0ABT6AE50_9ACTN|nr:hypothetical protein [Streptomyces tropicalis]MDF3302940.1 hypothetical protein [Streptomyces tropicalis]
MAAGQRHVYAAWNWWDECGRPGRTRFGVSAERTDARRSWLDSPATPLPGQVAAGRAGAG